MKGVLRLLGFVVVGVLLLVVVGVAGLYAWTNRQLATVVPVPTHAFTAPTGDSVVARGEHVTKALAKCADCHGDDYGGKVLVSDPAIGTVYVPNITPGPGGRLATMTDADIERTIRHGVNKEGRRLIIMPSHEYQHLSDDDVGAIIAYLRTVPGVARDTMVTRFGPLARALFVAGKMPWFPAMSVTHASEVVPTVPVDSTVEYGRYLAVAGCSGCHGVNYSGGQIGGAPPDWPQAANITPTGLAAYTYESFVHALSTGERPDGTRLNPVMPIQATKLMTPVEMTAVWKYLQSVAPAEFGVR